MKPLIHNHGTKKASSARAAERAEDMAKDTRYLAFVGNSWHFDYLIPKRLQKWFKIRRLRHSLNTSDVDHAIKLRDTYLRPVIASFSVEELLKQLEHYLELSGQDLEAGVGKLKTFMKRREDTSVISLKDVCEHFMKHYRKSNPSPASISKYNSAISAACLIMDGNTPANSIEKRDILNLRDALLSAPVRWMSTGVLTAKPGEQTLNSNTVKGIVCMMRSIFSRAIEDELLDMSTNPVVGVEVMETKPKSKRPPEGKEVECLCSLPMPRSTFFNEEAWRMLPILARYTGCRVGELALLNAQDVIDKGEVKCLRITSFGEGKRLKTDSSERFVPVSDKLLPHLERLLKNHPSGRLFPKCGDMNGPEGNLKPAHYFDKAYNRAAKDIAPDLSFHCWRVYANTQMADAGIDILDREAILGHKSDRIQRAYTAENLQRLKRAVDSIA